MIILSCNSIRSFYWFSEFLIIIMYILAQASMSFGLHRFYSNRSSDQSSPTSSPNNAPRIVVRSFTGAATSASVNIAQGLILADTKSKVKPNTTFPPPDIKLKCARYAIEVSGPKAALKKFESEYPRYRFSRQSISRWTKMLKKAIESGSSVSEAIFSSHVGHPVMLDPYLTQQVKDLVIGSREAGASILRRDVINIGHGVILSKNPNLLLENGGSIKLTEKWARGLLSSLNMVKRRGTTAKRKIPELLYEETKFSFQRNISMKIREHNIPPSLVINLDQTPLSYVTNENYTFAELGSNTVPIASSDDKRAITGTFACSAEGHFLPLQLIYKGKSKLCLPKYSFPQTFDVIYNEKHWANETTAITFLEKIIVPFVTDEKVLLGLPETQKILLIFDVFKGHLTSKVNEVMLRNNIVHELVPPNMTSLFQPLDITVNRYAKRYIRNLYSAYYTGEVRKQLDGGVAPCDVKINLKLSKLKPMHAEWLVKLYNDMQGRPELIKKGFDKAGITAALSMDYLMTENPFDDDDM